MNEIIAMVRQLRISHYYCEDTWYSCPHHHEGCADPDAGDECTCGAEQHNALIEEIIQRLEDM